MLRRPETRGPDAAQQLAQRTAPQADRTEAVTLARDFAALVRTRQPERLAGGLARATTSAVSALQRFAQGLRDDDGAVTAGVTVPWRNGPVAGHIHRLKMRKRQRLGRAHLDRLRRRFVQALDPAPPPAPGQRTTAPAEAEAA